MPDRRRRQNTASKQSQKRLAWIRTAGRACGTRRIFCVCGDPRDKEETGLTILNPRLVGVKQFPLENGRYVVLLFKATQWSGDLISSEEGQMECIKYSDLSVVKTVDDFDDLLKVMNTPELTEFQYLV